MLKFFRKIRQELISENRFSKYLLYAIGEILLVVIGILLALQINNWNQKRLEREEEQAALLNLKKDFEVNEANLLQSINYLQENINGTLSILDHTGQKYQPHAVPDLDSLLLFPVGTPRYFPQDGFLNEIINSGKLSIIQNDSLRSLLSSWQSSLGFINDRTSVNHSESLKLGDFIVKHGSWLKIDSGVSPNHTGSLKYIQLPPSGFEKSNVPLLQSIEFENLLDMQLAYKDGLMDAFHSTLEVCKQIQEKINQEIK